MSERIQLPVGTVGLGESIEAAAYREIAHWMGLEDAVHNIVRLGSTHESLSTNQRIALRMTKIFDAPTYDASSAGFALQRGDIVQIEGVSGKFAAIRCDPLDESLVPPGRVSGITGFVRTSLLATMAERHFYHISLMADTETAWEEKKEDRQIQLSWQPLDSIRQLSKQHQSWYENYLPILTDHYL